MSGLRGNVDCLWRRKTESGAMDWKRKTLQKSAAGFAPVSHGPQQNFELVVEVCPTLTSEPVHTAPQMYCAYMSSKVPAEVQ